MWELVFYSLLSTMYHCYKIRKKCFTDYVTLMETVCNRWHIENVFEQHCSKYIHWECQPRPIPQAPTSLINEALHGAQKMLSRVLKQSLIRITWNPEILSHSSVVTYLIRQHTHNTHTLLNQRMTLLFSLRALSWKHLYHIAKLLVANSCERENIKIAN